MMTLSRSTLRMRSRITRYWFLGIELLVPFSEPGFLRGGHLLLERGERVAPACALLPADLGDDLIEHQRGIADHGMVDAVLLVDIRGVIGRMDNRLAGRHARAERGAREARADRQHEVRFGHEVVTIFGRERVDAPSASGWFSAMVLLPGFVVRTGAGMSSAKAVRRSLASA